ncbi:hypothetical protein BDV19DRAFT_380411 [Aspergillus venezuelensis]
MSLPVLPRSLAPDEKYQQSLAYGLIISTNVLSLLVCSLCTRLVVIKKFGWDDAAVTITQAFNGLGIAVVYYGQGRHMQNVSPESRETWLKLYYAAMCMYLYTSLSVKISILIFLRRVFIKIWLQRLTAGLIMFHVLFSVTGSFVLAFQCSPPRAAYDQSAQMADCYSPYTLYQIVLYQAVLIFMVIEFNLGLVAGSLSSLRPLRLFRYFGSTKDSKYQKPSHETPQEPQNLQRSGRRKKGCLGMGTALIQETGNESQEHIIGADKGQ